MTEGTWAIIATVILSGAGWAGILIWKLSAISQSHSDLKESHRDLKERFGAVEKTVGGLVRDVASIKTRIRMA